MSLLGEHVIVFVLLATDTFQKNGNMTSLSDSVCSDKFCLNVFFRLTSRYYVRQA